MLKNRLAESMHDEIQEGGSQKHFSFQIGDDSSTQKNLTSYMDVIKVILEAESLKISLNVQQMVVC